MKILLVRHGESVDNVAGIYAGSRDSPLTSHGVLQAKHLGKHLFERSSALGPLKHVFTSDLQRAFLTAEAIIEAHSSIDAPATVDVLRLTELREKDFGILEGVKFGLTSTVGPGQRPETSESIRARVERFLESHLLPVVRASATDQVTVIIVAHGLILSDLVKALALQFSPANVTIAADGFDIGGRHYPWRNTGYLEALVEPVEIRQENIKPVADAPLVDMRLIIQAVNRVDHLKGVKKTGGGIGSARHDSSQKTIDSFFKK